MRPCLPQSNFMPSKNNQPAQIHKTKVNPGCTAQIKNELRKEEIKIKIQYAILYINFDLCDFIYKILVS